MGNGQKTKKAAPCARFGNSSQLTPLDEINGFKVRPGLYELPGATALQEGVNFTVLTKEGTGVELLLFKNHGDAPFAVIPFPRDYRIGNTYSMIVFDLDVEAFEYAYRVDGPYAPEKGLLFDKTRILLDPYARAVTGQSVWGERGTLNGFYKARVVKSDFDWGKNENPLAPMEDVIIYELHVRGFTNHPSSKVTHPGTFAGLIEKIPYLKDLGITAVELMPVFEFDETKDIREVDGQKLLDYWGYNPISFFSPNTSYASCLENNREGQELKELIRALNNNGIECYLDVVFNHTAEGDAKGPFISFKGFDNRVWYMLTPDGYYYNFSGCGNTLNCSHPIVQKMIVDCLHYWTIEYHVDGFRFDLASILGRDQSGQPLCNPPLLERLAHDPILADVKLIAEAWDAGGLYQVGSFPAWKRWSEWNGKYRDDMRDFLKGGYAKTQSAISRILGSTDLYPRESRGVAASVNFLNCHDGFTLWDMYSYQSKHNEGNGWCNVDGSDDNRSWNCGVEGDTDREDILALRRKLCRNAIAVLMMSRGTPLFFAGDEFLNSQKGNNNAYCQDNEISWLNWGDLERNRSHFEFTRFMIRLRKRYPAIRKPVGSLVCGLPEVTVIYPTKESKAVGIIYAGQDPICYRIGIAINVFWEAQKIELPALPRWAKWNLYVDTSGEYLENYFSEDESGRVSAEGESLLLQPRSVIVFGWENRCRA